MKYIALGLLCLFVSGCSVASNRALTRARVNYQQGTVLDPIFMQSLRNGG